MKKILFCLSLYLIVYCLMAMTIMAAPKPYADGSMPTVKRAPDGADVVVCVSEPPGPNAHIQVERKLFPWGWRQKGLIRGSDVCYRDPKPAKRTAWYRVRLVFVSGQKGLWSRPVKFDPKAVVD